jgi:hypothetical protein
MTEPGQILKAMKRLDASHGSHAEWRLKSFSNRSIPLLVSGASCLLSKATDLSDPSATSVAMGIML